MNHAGTYTKGQDRFAHKATAGAAAPPVGRVRTMDAKTKGPDRGKGRQKAVVAAPNVTDAFLKNAFPPRVVGASLAASPQAQKRTESGFYRSLALLTAYYGIDDMPNGDRFGFPANLSIDLDMVSRQLSKKVEFFQNIRLSLQRGNTFLSCTEGCPTHQTLYYIPVLPLHRLMQQQGRSNNAQLLLSVFAYLYRNVQVPYYRKKESYLYWIYEMATQEDGDHELGEEPAPDADFIEEVLQARMFGDYMLQVIGQPLHLDQFGQRLEAFGCKDQFDTECLELAREAFNLYTEYPHQSIFRNAGNCHYLSDELDTEDREIVEMQCYISFYADTKGSLSQCVTDLVNCELQEYAALDEPCIIRHFDGRENSTQNLSFERRIFDLINGLVYLLNNIN